MGIIFIVMEIFYRYYFHGYGKKKNLMCMKILHVGHMFESLLNEFMGMKDFWVDWDIVGMS